MGFQLFFLLFLIVTHSQFFFFKITNDYELSIDPVYYVSFVSRQQHHRLNLLPSHLYTSSVAFTFLLLKSTTTEIKTVQLILVSYDPC